MICKEEIVLIKVYKDALMNERDRYLLIRLSDTSTRVHHVEKSIRPKNAQQLHDDQTLHQRLRFKSHRVKREQNTEITADTLRENRKSLHINI